MYTTSFGETLTKAAGAAWEQRDISWLDNICIRGTVRRANRGWGRPQQTLADCQDYVIGVAVSRGLIKPEDVGDDFDWDKLLELITNIIAAIIELIKWFGI